MNQILPLFIFLLLCSTLSAQEPSQPEPAPCGTRGVDPWLVRYTARPQDYAVPRSDDTLYVGIQIHLLAKDNGSGRFSYDKLLSAFCRLNTDYAPSGIRFYFKNPWNEINQTTWWDHNDIPQGIQMMQVNDVLAAQNSYFVSDPAGNCGYNIPYASVAINHNCANENDHTWAHEIGHALSLPHPFIGWEGKVYNFSTQTPDTLTYDYTYFHDTLETQIPAPLDTALVEYVDGSNCTLAADLFCDTKPDYLSQRWFCDGQNNSIKKQKDPDGVEFYSDGTLYMSYSSDECQNRFTPEQIAAMRANLLSEKIDWLTTGPPQADVNGLSTPVDPVNDAPTPNTEVSLHWTPVPNATHYLVTGSRVVSFAARDIEIITDDTMAVTGALFPNKKYYWRVRAFNDWSTCAAVSETATFKTAAVSAVSEADVSGLRIYPTLAAPGTPLWLETSGKHPGGPVVCQVFDASGRRLWHQELNFSGTRTQLNLPSATWQAGVYQVVVTSAQGAHTQRLALMK